MLHGGDLARVQGQTARTRGEGAVREDCLILAGAAQDAHGVLLDERDVLPPLGAAAEPMASSLPISGIARRARGSTPSSVATVSHLVIQSVTSSRKGMFAAGTRPTPWT